MVADFYPRLSAVADNNRECNRLVNEQAEISLLLAGPGVIATMTFAPLVLALFYTGRFAGAAEPLRWISVGMALRVIAWPIGFVVLAKGIQKIFFWTELAATIVHVGLAYLLVKVFGLRGAAMAFVGLYVWHAALMYFIVRRLTGFRWSALSRQCILVFVPMIALVFGLFYYLPFWAATAVGTAAVIGTGIYSVRLLTQLVPIDRSPRLIQQLLRVLRIVPNHAA